MALFAGLRKSALRAIVSAGYGPLMNLRPTSNPHRVLTTDPCHTLLALVRPPCADTACECA